MQSIDADKQADLQTNFFEQLLRTLRSACFISCVKKSFFDNLHPPSTMHASSTEHPSPPRTVPLSATAEGGSEILSLLINY